VLKGLNDQAMSLHQWMNSASVQQQNTEREPVVVSSSAPAPKAQKEVPIEVQQGKRKIILD
jgi:hypothetical protein